MHGTIGVLSTHKNKSELSLSFMGANPVSIMIHDAPAPPQQARSRATRKKLLNACVDCLCCVGFSNTTTTMIAKKAGVSQGALFKHFASKPQLIAATTQHLFTKLFDEFREAFSIDNSHDDVISSVLPALWAVFLKPELYVVVELYIAARTDDSLREALVPVTAQHREHLLEEARRLFPVSAAKNPRFDVAVDAIMATMQGAAISAVTINDPPRVARFTQFLEHVCRRELTPHLLVES